MWKRIRGAFALALAVACVLGAALLLVGNASTTGTRQASPIDVSKSVAKKFIAAATALNEDKVAALYTRNAVQVDKTAGVTVQGRDSIARSWGQAFHTADIHWHGALTCASPDWAVVNWVLQSPSNLYQGGKMRTPGISILEIKNGKIVRETMYYERIDTR